MTLVKAALWDRIVSFVRRQSPNKPTEEESTTAMMERKNAVLVFGASGRVGSRVVQEVCRYCYSQSLLHTFLCVPLEVFFLFN